MTWSAHGARNAPAHTVGCGPRWVQRVNAGLDRSVEQAHRLLPGRYHPYFLAEDIGAIGFIGIGFAFQVYMGALSGAIYAAAIGLTYMAYVTVFLKIKRHVTGVGARSAIQDSVFFVMPMYLVLSWAMGQDLSAAVDALAFALLIAIMCMRIGCFLGGCCHGRPSRMGVRYSPGVLRAIDGVRLFTPSEFTGVRVFPLQLVEAAYLGAVLVALWLRESSLAHPDGSTLALAAIGYTLWRFGAEFLRGHRHRPKYGGLSEAQIFALCIAAGSSLWLLTS
jgi:phosphatidylglycerol---prolipoprotein diacylglyceryl transferase